MRRWLVLGVALALAASAGAASAAIRLFSYDPANKVTERTAGDLTFEFRQQLIFVTLLRVMSTEGQASADVKPVDEHALGHGGLSRLIGDTALERDVYQVEPQQQGADMIKAFCPGSDHAWLAVGHIAENRPLTVHVIGDNPAGGPTRLCATLKFTFRGEWRAPSDADIEHHQATPPPPLPDVPGPS
jgi:hypothetical protein